MTPLPIAQLRDADCRACGGELHSFLNLGNLRPSTFPLPGQGRSWTMPFNLCTCDTCGLVQLRHTLDANQMFREYWYHSGINETMIIELESVVTEALEFATIESGDYVVDVGANDGTLLQTYRKDPRTLDVPRVAFEPADNLQEALKPHAEIRVHDFFPSTTTQLDLLRHRVKILTSIAMFYDLDNPHAFLSAVEDVLAPKGIWILQFQDLAQMLQARAFDNICAEHLCYYSLQTFETLLRAHDLRVIAADRRAINGGSYRIVVGRKDWWHEGSSVARLRAWEAGSHCQSWQTLEMFAWQVSEARRQIQAAVEHASAYGPVHLYGASTKANTLLQYCGFDRDVISQAWERSPEKWGRETVTGIPIVSEEVGRSIRPAAALVGIWQFRQAVIAREQAYLNGGGSLIVPLPAVDIVGKGVRVTR